MQDGQLGMLFLAAILAGSLGLMAYWTYRVLYRDEIWDNRECRFVKVGRRSLSWWVYLAGTLFAIAVATAFLGMVVGATLGA